MERSVKTHVKGVQCYCSLLLFCCVLVDDCVVGLKISIITTDNKRDLVPRGLRYPCPAEGAREALEESKTGKPPNPGSGLSVPA